MNTASFASTPANCNKPLTVNTELIILQLMLEHINKPGFLPDEEGTLIWYGDMLCFMPKHSKQITGIRLTGIEYTCDAITEVSYWNGKEWKPVSGNTDNKFSNRPVGNSMGM